MPTRPGSSPHRWRFFRAGGLDQVHLETGADLAHLDQLDPKLWVALACPVKGLDFDEKTLALIDADNDGRVRASDLLAAIGFCREALKSLDTLVPGSDSLRLDAIDDTKPAGKAAFAAARRVFESLGKSDSTTIELAQVLDTKAVFASTRFNGDGVVTAETAETAGSPELAKLVAEVVAALGGEEDRSGAQGVSQAKVDLFFDELAAFEAWAKTAEDSSAEILPLGEKTAAAAAAFAAVEAKVDDYFTRCRLAAFDPRAQAPLNRAEEEYAAIAAKTLSCAAEEVASFPLARVEPGRALTLVEEVNPAWSARMAALASDAVAPLLGESKHALTEQEWEQLRGKLAPHLAWASGKPAAKVESLGLSRARELLASNAKDELTALIEKDKAAGAELEGIASLEKLVRFHRDLFRLLHNFVAFTDFYAPDKRAIFQAGTLYLDSRSCELCVQVDDPARHAAMAGLAKCYIAYCDCTRPNGEKTQIAAVFSDGDSDYLMVGRNGVFYDRQGRDWDATITKIIDNPISIRQAFWSPYKKFLRLVEEQVQKRAGAADQANQAELLQAADKTANLDKANPPRKKLDLGAIALIGVAISGAAAAIGGLLEAFFGLGIWMPLGLAGIVLAISGPSMLIAALKLRQRNLGPVLDANGWAINGRVKVNIPFGSSLTRMPAFPRDSERSLTDPYQPRRSPWAYGLQAALVLALVAGTAVLAYHKGWMPRRLEQPLGFLGVPAHLTHAKARAQEGVEEARKLVASAQEQLEAAAKGLDAAAGKDAAALARAQARFARAQARHDRALDRLDLLERRLERAVAALEAAIDAQEARTEALEAAAIAEELARLEAEAAREAARAAAEPGAVTPPSEAKAPAEPAPVAGSAP
ncbi:MAG: hypothetical protein ACOX6T_05375 [Myxococcales bacterium]|jgi:hypothetical protein